MTKPVYCFDDFRFDMAGAILDQLISAFESLEIGRLTPEMVEPIPHVRGVYQLYYSDDLVYVGKSDLGLGHRLARHQSMLLGRLNIHKRKLGFKALAIDDNWSAFATEDRLVKYFGDGLSWNNSGFGSNDPGRNRDGTAEPPDSFNSMYPINGDFPCNWIAAGEYKADDILSALKSGLPYLLRYQSDAAGKALLSESNVTIEESGLSARELLKQITMQLTGTWQATMLPGRMLLYHERREFVHGEIIWPE